MPDYQRRYALEPLVKSRQQLEFEALLKQRVRATVEEPCPRCKNPVLEYYTMQLRSADEGQVRAGGRGVGWVAGWQGGRVLPILRQAHAPCRPPALHHALPSTPPQTVFYECRQCDYRYSTNN
jgi:DNA-directed RNA polymerase subunit M/transcription elongation factor TFIIS